MAEEKCKCTTIWAHFVWLHTQVNNHLCLVLLSEKKKCSSVGDKVWRNCGECRKLEIDYAGIFSLLFIHWMILLKCVHFFAYLFCHRFPYAIQVVCLGTSCDPLHFLNEHSKNHQNESIRTNFINEFSFIGRRNVLQKWQIRLTLSAIYTFNITISWRAHRFHW